MMGHPSDLHVNLLLEHLTLHVIVLIWNLSDTIEPTVWVLSREMLRRISLANRPVVAWRIAHHLPREPVQTFHSNSIWVAPYGPTVLRTPSNQWHIPRHRTCRRHVFDTVNPVIRALWINPVGVSSTLENAAGGLIAPYRVQRLVVGSATAHHSQRQRMECQR